MPHIINLLQSDSKINTGLISSNIVTTVKNLSRKSKSNLILKSMKKQIITGLESSSVYISYGCLKIVVKLIYSNIWRDEETVNVIATLVFNKHNKVNRKALSVMSNEHIDDDSSDEDEATVAREKYKQISMANKISKTTNKRKRKLQTAVKHMKNAKKPKNVQPNDKTLVRLIYDTDKYSSRLFKKLEFGKEHFPVKMVIMKLISRMIDEFKIIMPNFITFLYRYIHPRQKDVTKILLYLALSMHTNVPNETVLASMRVVSNAFINDRNSDDAVTVGINTIREISIRCINAIDKELLMDLIEYRKMKNRNIKSAASDSQSDSENESNVNSNIESASETTESENELDLNKIEKMIKRKKQTKIEKLNTVNEGRADREKFGKKKTKFKVATSNKEKRKTKNFMMLRQKFIKNSRKKTYVQRLFVYNLIFSYLDETRLNLISDGKIQNFKQPIYLSHNDYSFVLLPLNTSILARFFNLYNVNIVKDAKTLNEHENLNFIKKKMKFSIYCNEITFHNSTFSFELVGIIKLNFIKLCQTVSVEPVQKNYTYFIITGVLCSFVFIFVCSVGICYFIIFRKSKIINVNNIIERVPFKTEDAKKIWKPSRFTRFNQLVHSTEEDYTDRFSQLEFFENEVHLESILIQGTFAQFFVGTIHFNKDYSKSVLIKTYQEAVCDEQVKRTFLTQANLLLGLSHSNICSVIGIQNQIGIPLLIYPYMNAGNLKLFLQDCNSKIENNFSPQHISYLCIKLFKAVQYIHRQRLLHSDIGTRNCFISTDFDFKLCDKSLSQDIFPEDYAFLNDDYIAAKWAAPELLSCAKFSMASDVWASAVTIWEIYTLAEEPYKTIQVDQLQSHLKLGNRLRRPRMCPIKM
ncbi:hypothetical protein A3Q56_02331 [Intoshia linei]|uniref:Protein kinase domain-containing protein n=1 Tax=Intoshia linei TaxID=1819745 RepID=A0A177B6H7_9BILA|nr:hypothetical protein A3Q56_02331 [Intoshia linei]